GIFTPYSSFARRRIASPMPATVPTTERDVAMAKSVMIRPAAVDTASAAVSPVSPPSKLPTAIAAIQTTAVPVRRARRPRIVRHFASIRLSMSVGSPSVTLGSIAAERTLIVLSELFPAAVGAGGRELLATAALPRAGTGLARELGRRPRLHDLRPLGHDAGGCRRIALEERDHVGHRLHLVVGRAEGRCRLLDQRCILLRRLLDLSDRLL